MQIHLPDLSAGIIVYMLVFARVGAMVMLLPNIGDNGIPARVRLILALAISLRPDADRGGQLSARPRRPASWHSLLVAQETTIGILVGAMARASL